MDAATTTTPLTDLVKQLLTTRGHTTDEAIRDFLNPDYQLSVHDPFLMPGMEDAVARIFAAIAAGERIAIYADFDCDGIPGASVLHDFFKKIGYDNFEVYLPHRDREGYGVHVAAIEALAKKGITLMITVDVGTTAIEQVKRAKELGVDVIITDHHEILNDLPEAVAIINPKREGYPFKDLCGAGTAFKLVQAMLIEGKSENHPLFTGIPEGWEKWLLDLVAIATVADMVPLVGENRVLAYWGLQVLRKSPRPGIIALCDKARIRLRDITEDDIGFCFAPRINAASRMGEPDLALKLLTTRDRKEAETIADELESLNASRKGIVGGIVKEAKKRARDRFPAENLVAVLGDPDWKPALLGLAANSVVEDRGGIVCLWGRDAAGNLKGSCRSDGSLSVVDLFTGAREAFQEFGGHAASGGFSITLDQAHALPEVLEKAAQQMIRTEAKNAAGPADAYIMLAEVAQNLLKNISRLAPFGIGNPKPIFRISRVRVGGVKRFGKEKNHVEIFLTCNETGTSCRAFQFFRSPEDFTYIPTIGHDVDVLATIERDSFRGPYALALRIIDVLSS